MFLEQTLNRDKKSVVTKKSLRTVKGEIRVHFVVRQGWGTCEENRRVPN